MVPFFSFLLRFFFPWFFSAFWKKGKRKEREGGEGIGRHEYHCVSAVTTGMYVHHGRYRRYTWKENG